MNIAKIYEYQKNNILCKQILEEAKKILQPGISELEVFTRLKVYIESIPEIERLWHPIKVKFDHSTLNTEITDKPSETSTYNEIAIIDIGIVANGIELDDAKTFGITSEAKILIEKTDQIMKEFKALIEDIRPSPRQAFLNLCDIALFYGVTQIAPTAGHVLGEFPTRKSKIKIRESEEAEFFTPGSWMLEVHVQMGNIAAFKEELIFLK